MRDEAPEGWSDAATRGITTTHLSCRPRVVPFPPMAAKARPRPAHRPPTGKPASPLIKGGPRGVAAPAARPSALLDTRIIYCGDCLDQLRKLPDACVDLIYIDPPFNSNQDYEVFWGETKETRGFEDRHASTQAYIDYMRPRCVELARVLKKTGSFYYHCDWHASHYVKVMLDQIFSENSFQNEIVWKRTSAHGNVGRRYAIVEDRLLFYVKSASWTWNAPYLPYDAAYIESHYAQSDGRRFTEHVPFVVEG